MSLHGLPTGQTLGGTAQVQPRLGVVAATWPSRSERRCPSNVRWGGRTRR